MIKTEDFTEEEFICPCCGKNKMMQEFINKLQDARTYAGVPFVITSGFRCKKHNRKVGGRKNSPHLDGWGCDIQVNGSRERYLIINALLYTGFNRIGIGKDFIHVDMDYGKVGEVIWDYNI